MCFTYHSIIKSDIILNQPFTSPFGSLSFNRSGVIASTAIVLSHCLARLIFLERVLSLSSSQEAALSEFSCIAFATMAGTSSKSPILIFTSDLAAAPQSFHSTPLVMFGTDSYFILLNFLNKHIKIHNPGTGHTILETFAKLKLRSIFFAGALLHKGYSLI